MIQDIKPSIFKNEYLDIKADKGDFICFVENRKILLNINNDSVNLPRYEDINTNFDSYYLFSIDNKRFFMSLDKVDISLLDYEYYDSRTILELKPKEHAYACLVAIQLVSWINDNKYCGKCGHKSIFDHQERMLKCPSCNNLIYPRLNPCIIVGITDKDKIVVTKAKNSKNKYYSLVSGFCEIGESLEETIKREVKEEVGLNVKNIKYYKSQPWPLSDSLLMGFYCELDGDNNITIQESELDNAFWINRKDIEDRKNLNSLTAEMIDNFKYNM